MMPKLTSKQLDDVVGCLALLAIIAIVGVAVVWPAFVYGDARCIVAECRIAVTP